MPVAPLRRAGTPPSHRAEMVMDLRCQGYNYAQIGHMLGLSRSTIGVYVQMVYDYLGTHHPSEARARWHWLRSRPTRGQFDAPCDFC